MKLGQKDAGEMTLLLFNSSSIKTRVTLSCTVLCCVELVHSSVVLVLGSLTGYTIVTLSCIQLVSINFVQQFL
jgi:hypothetical protein